MGLIIGTDWCGNTGHEKNQYY